MLNWSIALEDGVVALLRYTLDLRGGGAMPDAAALDAQLERMVRGWVPAVEAALAETGRRARAPRGSRCATRGAFPQAYRNASAAEEAARDILRLAELDGRGRSRSVRLFPARAGDERRLKLYRLGGALAAVRRGAGAREFRLPRDRGTADRAAGEAGALRPRFRRRWRRGDARAATRRVLEGAIAAVLEGAAENDAFNRLIVDGGHGARSPSCCSAPGSAICARPG